MVFNFKVNSSAIHKVSYNAKTKILTLTFTSSDRAYDYGPIPAREVVQLMKAPSIGKHYKTIRYFTVWGASKPLKLKF